ncbi:MAG TPA: phosphatase PAP2 family protein [Myxococcaceae bacterium]|nr:phosphatase PAP2 family protein [Myxococcaceae bacterium]
MDDSRTLADEHRRRWLARAVRDRLRRHRRGLVELFLGVLVPLCGLALLARLVVHPQPPPWDLAVLRWIHSYATPGRDRMAAWVTDLGTWGGVTPLTIALLAYLLFRRRIAQSLFVLLSMVGSWILNDAAKAFYGRERPALWNSATREMWFGFPSGHAMASMALGTVVTILAWRTPARWAALALSAIFVVAVSASRLYLGVHYPSDVMAAWLASLAWVIGLRLLVFPRAHRSPRTRG